MRVILAPDRFSGTLSAPQAAEAMAAGWRSRAPHDDVVLVPLSDGGPGFVAALAASLGGRSAPVVVTGPGGRPGLAQVLVATAPDPRGPVVTAYVESAQVCGRDVGGPLGGDPAGATTAGMGALVRQAVATGASRVVVGVGGCGTVDGGRGMIDALGGLRAARDLVSGVDLVLASDVDPPLLGRDGAAYTFAREQGAEAAQRDHIEARMGQWLAGVVAELAAVGVPATALAATPGAGAGGGLGMALLAMGARREPGAQVSADAVALEVVAAGADLLVSGEGALDFRSLRGKVVTAVARTGQRVGVPVVVVAGQVQLGRRELASAGIDAAYAVVAGSCTEAGALADPVATLRERTGRVAATWSPGHA